MYYCFACDSTFDKPKTEYQSVPYGMGNAHFDFGVCPLCGSDDIEEACLCRECGKVLTEDTNFGGLCKECITENMNLATTMFDFCNETATKKETNEFAIKCLGYDGINEILRAYFVEKCKEDYNCFEKERKKFIDEFAQDIGEWLAKKESEVINGKT